MEIKEIKISNYKKISSEASIDISKELLIIGKNNTAKTSFFEVVNSFLTSNGSFKVSDFNKRLTSKYFINELYERYSDDLEEAQLIELYNDFPFISLSIVLQISSNDNIAVIKPLLYEFSNNEIIEIKCFYRLNSIKKIFDDFKEYNSNIEPDKRIEFYDFFNRNLVKYYLKSYYSNKPNTEYLNKVEEKFIYSIFNIYTIAAQRNVDDTSEQEKQTISNAIWSFYNKKKKGIEKLIDNDDEFKDAIDSIQTKLNDSYQIFFSELINTLNEKIINDDPSKKINILSEFDIEDILKKNSKVKYTMDNEVILSESYNGLGYSNLLYIFIQIEAFKFEIRQNEAIFNILFIEEPESHLHPQMQSVFLRKLEDALKDEEDVYKMITTHSSYILQSTNIENIRYFIFKNQTIEVKSLSAFTNKEEYIDLKEIIKKYFRLNTCDLFFADKAILIEGNAERIIMPSLFKIFDDNNITKLSEQHISIFEVSGAYAYIFINLLEFLELKSLIITDIDSVEGQHNKKCKCNITSDTDAQFTIKTSNSNIKNWFADDENAKYIKNISLRYSEKEKRIVSEKIVDDEGNVILTIDKRMITFQVFSDKNIWGRTLEEQFIIENSQWIKDNIAKLESLHEAIRKAKKDDGITLNLSHTSITKEELETYFFEIVENIDKCNFANNLLEFDGWIIPLYIKEGLEWIAN